MFDQGAIHAILTAETLATKGSITIDVMNQINVSRRSNIKAFVVEIKASLKEKFDTRDCSHRCFNQQCIDSYRLVSKFLLQL